MFRALGRANQDGYFPTSQNPSFPNADEDPLFRHLHWMQQPIPDALALFPIRNPKLAGQLHARIPTAASSLSIPASVVDLWTLRSCNLPSEDVLSKVDAPRWLWARGPAAFWIMCLPILPFSHIQMQNGFLQLKTKSLLRRSLRGHLNSCPRQKKHGFAFPSRNICVRTVLVLRSMDTLTLRL